MTLRVHTAQGTRAHIRRAGASAGFTSDAITVAIADLANAAIEVEIVAPALGANPDVVASYPIRGRVLDGAGRGKIDGYQVVVFAAVSDAPDGSGPEFRPVAFATTETGGYFVTGLLQFDRPDDLRHVRAAKATVSRGAFTGTFPIALIVQGGDDVGGTSRLPDRLILVVDDASASAGQAPGECGCTDLDFHEKKALEEFTYFTVVRTSEPSIIADVLEDEREIDLQDLFGIPGRVPVSVFRKFQAIQSAQPRLLAAAPAAPSGVLLAARPAALTLNKDLLDRLVFEHKVGTAVKGPAEARFKGRTFLDQQHQIDWDDEPTIYQAASVAHGHLLQFKQEWVPDGYSIGDLAYSLPLAPGQKKQIAVLDWERRESAANSQSLEFEESLNNTLVRDRDVSDIVNGTLTENIRANSRATTSGIGFGLGGAVLGAFSGGTFGALLGVSGGTSSSGANASQSATRTTTAQSLQSLTDRTMQSASVVRAQRATVVQTVSQGERVQATAESVANYNHCHALTIQYFEVLRHFQVRHRLAGVQECLFVPLQIGPFDLEKALRWRTSLERHLLRRDLRQAFDALARIASEKESPFENYYDSIGFPRRNFAEQAIRSFSGDLFLEFFFFNTKAQKVDDETIAFFARFGISLDHLRDRAITDDELARHVGPRTAEFLLDAFTVATDTGVDLKLDLTLLSSFRQGVSLRVSVRQAAGTPTTVAREQIAGIAITLDTTKLSAEVAASLAQFQNKFMKIRLRSGDLRYRTENFAGTLFSGRIENDIFAGSDGAFLPTPLTREELRNPRGEDVSAANHLIRHLNENLEHYHKCLFFDMTPERRFMLLDGIVAPGKANGRSVASVVENRVIGVAGNSLIMPVAPGFQLDPGIDERFDLQAHYFSEPADPVRISVPTKGIYAEAVMGKCNSCEVKDESRFWRWEESPIPDSPSTPILPIDTGTRRADPGNLQPKDFPAPIVNIQNAPAAPEPAGVQGVLQLLGKGDSFRDLTGLNQTQLNALAAFQKSLDTAQAFGKEASDLAKTAAAMKLIEDAQKNGTLTNEEAKANAKKVLDNFASQDAGVAKLKQALETVGALQTNGVLPAATAEKAKQDLLKAFVEQSTGKEGITPEDVKELSDKAKANGTDISVKKKDDTVDIKKTADTGFSGNTVTQTLQMPNLANHQGYGGRFQLRVNLEADRTFRVELINNAVDFADFGPLAARNPAHITLDADSPPFGIQVPINPQSTALLYKGRLGDQGTPGDVFPAPTASVTLGNKQPALKSGVRCQLPFTAGVRIPCVQGRNTGTHTGGSAFAIDFGVPRGTPVLAAAEGIVVDIVSVEPDQPIGTRGTNENLVRVRTFEGTYHVYGHLLRNGVVVQVGQRVTAGTVLGRSGNSGNTDGDHLHFVVERATLAGFDSIDYDFFDANGQSFVPVTNRIVEAGAGLVAGKVVSGTGDPNGKDAGDVGDVYVRKDGAPGTVYYVKTSGAAGSNTGWTAKAIFP